MDGGSAKAVKKIKRDLFSLVRFERTLKPFLFSVALSRDVLFTLCYENGRFEASPKSVLFGEISGLSGSIL